MDAHDTILRPVVTEESMNLMDDKKYTFDVLISATRTQVHSAVGETFGVRAKNVNIMSVRGRGKRVGRYTGKTARRREAVIILTEGSSDIKIFNDNKEN